MNSPAARRCLLQAAGHNRSLAALRFLQRLLTVATGATVALSALWLLGPADIPGREPVLVAGVVLTALLTGTKLALDAETSVELWRRDQSLRCRDLLLGRRCCVDDAPMGPSAGTKQGPNEFDHPAG